MISLLCEILKNDTDEFICKKRNRPADLEIKLMATKGKTWGGSDKLGDQD